MPGDLEPGVSASSEAAQLLAADRAMDRRETCQRLPYAIRRMADVDHGKRVVTDHLEPYPPGSRLYYSLALDGRDVLLDSSLALDFKDASAFGRNVRIADERRKSIDSTWQTIVGKSRDVRDRANELRFGLEHLLCQ